MKSTPRKLGDASSPPVPVTPNWHSWMSAMGGKRTLTRHGENYQFDDDECGCCQPQRDSAVARAYVLRDSAIVAPPSDDVYYTIRSPINGELTVSENALERAGTADLQRLQDSGVEALQELARHGYTPHLQRLPNSTGVLVRHKTAADLVVYPDGTIRVPSNQPLKGHAPADSPIRRVSWRRVLLFLFGLIAYTVISAIIIVNLIATLNLTAN